MQEVLVFARKHLEETLGSAAILPKSPSSSSLALNLQKLSVSDKAKQRRSPSPRESKKPPPNPLWKTRLCERFEMDGNCPYGNKCTFAHGLQELRDRETHFEANVKVEVPKEAPLFKTKLCQKFEATGFCPYGAKCNFAHSQAELSSKPTKTKSKGPKVIPTAQ
jgi:hypothetical protein